jgi:hypothetical protein
MIKGNIELDNKDDAIQMIAMLMEQFDIDSSEVMYL